MLPQIVRALQDVKVEVRGDDRTIAACTTAGVTGVITANDKDWATEYCDLIISIRVVDTLDDAINHINAYGSRHTDGIITEDAKAVETFFSQVDAAGNIVLTFTLFYLCVILSGDDAVVICMHTFQ
jgi:glutamate-5-semialdehyde dehydrogenase